MAHAINNETSYFDIPYHNGSDGFGNRSQMQVFEPYTHPLDVLYVKAIFITLYIIVCAMCVIGKHYLIHHRSNPFFGL